MFAEETTNVELYSYDAEGVFVDTFIYRWSRGTGLAANSTLVKPAPTPAGFVSRWDGAVWEHVPDYRGMSEYNTITKEARTVTYVGTTKDGFTLTEPTSTYVTWVDGAWVDLRSPETVLEDYRNALHTVTRYKFYRTLREHGYRQHVIESSINTVVDDLRRDILDIGYREMPYYSRSDEFIQDLLELLNITPEAMDAIWEYMEE